MKKEEGSEYNEGSPPSHESPKMQGEMHNKAMAKGSVSLHSPMIHDKSIEHSPMPMHGKGHPLAHLEGYKHKMPK